MRKISHLIFIVMIPGINICIAEDLDYELKPESSMSIGAGYDSDKNRDFTALLDYEFSNFQHLGFTYSRSTIDDSSTQSYTVSMSTSAYESFSMDANIGYTEIPDALESHTLSGSANSNLENWHFSLSPKISTITLYLNDQRQNKFDIDTKGVEISASYFGFENLYISTHYFKNIFSEKPYFLEPKVFNSLATNTVQKIRIISKINELASNLEEQRYTLTVGRYFNWGNLDFSWSYVELFNVAQWLDFEVLAPYQETTFINSFSGSVNYEINKTFGIGVSSGLHSLSSDTNKMLFTSLQLDYRW